MTNSEADNPSSLPESKAAGKSWNWLQERLPKERLTKLDDWLVSQLEELEATYADMITQRSLQRDIRHEFAPSKRSAS